MVGRWPRRRHGEAREQAPLGAAYAFALPTRSPNDFNGDGVSDALFVNGSQSVATWHLKATAVSAAAVLGNAGRGAERSRDRRHDGAGLSRACSSPTLRRERSSMWSMFGAVVTAYYMLGRAGRNLAGRRLGRFQRRRQGRSAVSRQCRQPRDLGFLRPSIVGGGQIGNPGAGWTLVGERAISTATARPTCCSRAPAAHTRRG